MPIDWRSAGMVAVAVWLQVIQASPGSAWGAEPAPRSITVVGVGRERGAPDMAQLRFAVEHTAPTAKDASQAAAKAAAQVLETLRKEVGSGGRVETSGFQLNPVYRPPVERGAPDKPRPPEIVGYTATNQLFVETRRVDEVGTLIDAAIAAGAASVGSLTFALADPAPAQAKALQAAGADAAAQAKAIAQSLGVRLTTVLEAATEGGARPMPERYARGLAMTAEAASTPIEPGQIATEARLRVTYGIE